MPAAADGGKTSGSGSGSGDSIDARILDSAASDFAKGDEEVFGRISLQ
jgi:hypothetical protein